jgi:hypothetical protein
VHAEKVSGRVIDVGGTCCQVAVRGRPKRAAEGGLDDHLLNRADARTTIFENEAGDAAFEEC